MTKSSIYKQRKCDCYEKKQEPINICWNYPQAREIIPCVVEEFGFPTYDINVPNGLVYWKDPGIFSSLQIDDILSNHYTPYQHCDSLTGSFLVYIKPEYLSQLFLIDSSFGYLSIKFNMFVMCHNVRWITAISYVILRYLDSLECPNLTKPFSIQEAKSLIISILGVIDYDTKLYCILKRKIIKYVERNQEKYCNIIFENCNS